MGKSVVMIYILQRYNLVQDGKEYKTRQPTTAKLHIDLVFLCVSGSDSFYSAKGSNSQRGAIRSHTS